MGTKKGQRRKTARRAYEPKRRKMRSRSKQLTKWTLDEVMNLPIDFLKMKRKGK